MCCPNKGFSLRVVSNFSNILGHFKRKQISSIIIFRATKEFICSWVTWMKKTHECLKYLFIYFVPGFPFYPIIQILCCRYNLVFLGVTYLIPITVMAVCYTLMGRKLWGSKSIGEHTQHQKESIKSKRKVNYQTSSFFNHVVNQALGNHKFYWESIFFSAIKMKLKFLQFNFWSFSGCWI